MLVRSRQLNELFCWTQLYFSPTRGGKKKKTTNLAEKASVAAMKFYAVAEGRAPGVYDTWDECSAQVHRYAGAVFKSFPTREEAEHFVSERRTTAAVTTIHTTNGLATVTPMTRVNVIGVPVHVNRQREPTTPDVPAKKQVCVPTTGPPALADRQVVYVDGACPSNGKAGARAGYGGYYGNGDQRNFSRRVPPEENQTNNRGEMRAVLHAIQQGFLDAGASVNFDDPRVPEEKELKRPLRPLEILSDSRYTIDGLTSFHKKWERNGFKTAAGEPVRNQDLWRLLLAHRDTYNSIYDKQTKKKGTEGDGDKGITLTHVKGHSNIHGNEMADRLAVEGSKSVFWNVIE